MNLFKKVRTLRCVTEFTQAIEVLGRTVFEIEKMYGINLSLLLNNDTVMVEIESECATVSCLLNQNLLCTASFLFCEDDDDLTECVAYCKSNFKRVGLRSWLSSNCIIKQIDGKEPCMYFSPKIGQKSNEIVS